MNKVLLFAALALLASSAAAAASPFPGTIELAVDATDSAHGIFTAHETIPVVSPGDVTLLYPQWEIGSHAPTASVAELAGLVIRVDGVRVEWRRDPLDVYAFHVPVPAGARQITVDLQFLPPLAAKWLRPGMVGIQWHRILLYPAGWDVGDIPVSASLKLTEGLQTFSSLAGQDTAGGYRFDVTSLEKLVDAPAYAARHGRQIELTPGAGPPVRLDLVADAESGLAISPEETDRLKQLVVQAGKLFGPSPYRHYDAIVILSDDLPAGGIEHLEEGENFLPAGYFLDTAHQLENRDLIAHELAHAWNGRFRQPADLHTPDYNHPQGGSLLWVYEGQTEFWGRVLAARTGLRSLSETFDRIAVDAAVVVNRPGRAWKSLADSTNDAVYMAGHGVAWRDWQRREDYYPEGVLLWLDVEARLRELSGGKKGLDDFTRNFFPTPGSYSFEDVCAGLEAVAHDDWPNFLRHHLDSHDDADSIAGLARAGWRLIYTAEPTGTVLQIDGGEDQTYSIGLQVRENGVVRGVSWNGAAFQAGLAPGMRIRTVNGQSFLSTVLKAAVAASASEPLVFEVETGGTVRTVTIPYHGGLRYPRLERIADVPDRLTPLLAPRR